MPASGRRAVPYVLLAYTPPTCNQQARMLYAGARERLRREAEAGRCVELADAEELEDVEGFEARLRGED